MKKFWKKYRVWVIVAIIAILVALTAWLRSMTTTSGDHAGHDHGANDSHTNTQQGADSHAGHDHSNYDVGKSYAITEGPNKTWSVSVTTAHNEKVLVCDNLSTEPSPVKLNNSVLLLGDTANPVISARWAIFCNGMTGQVSQRYNGCLATDKTTVAMATNNGTAVEMKDAFTGTVLSTTALPDASAPDSRSIIQDARWSPNGDLTVTYWAGETTKTYDVKVPRK